MRVKVIRNGVDGFQLQHLEPGGKIKNVRPATVEEYNLYEMLRIQMEQVRREHELRAEAEEKAKKLDLFAERVKVAESRVEFLEGQMKNAEKMAQEADVDMDQMRARAQAAEAERDELRALLVEPKQA